MITITKIAIEKVSPMMDSKKAPAKTSPLEGGQISLPTTTAEEETSERIQPLPASAFASASTSMTATAGGGEEGDNEDEEQQQTLEEKRAYNRMVSARSRHRVKLKIASLEETAKLQALRLLELEQARNSLLERCRLLAAEVNQLRQILHLLPGLNSGATASLPSLSGASTSLLTTSFPPPLVRALHQSTAVPSIAETAAASAAPTTAAAASESSQLDRDQLALLLLLRAGRNGGNLNG